MSQERNDIFVNREISWLKFNERVLEEAEDQRVPLAERLKFIAIFCSNLDEFFMIRVGTLFDGLLIDKHQTDSKTDMTIAEQLNEIFTMTKAFSPRLSCAHSDIMEQLKSYGVKEVDFKAMDSYEEFMVTKHFQDEIFPLLSPQIVDKQHPFPFFRSGELHVGVQIATGSEQVQVGIVPVSNQFNRLYTFKEHGSDVIHMALVEDIILNFAEYIFKKNKVQSKFIFRVTRNGDINPEEAHDQDVDWRDEMEKLLRKRKKSIAVRLQLSCEIKPNLLNYLCKKLHLNEQEVVIESLPLDLSYVYGLSDRIEKSYPHLFYQPFPPLLPAGIVAGESMVKYIVNNGDLLLAYPFHSMKPFLDLLDESAVDPDVMCIKITLYRVATGSKVVSALMKAAENGKDVLVLVELRARFDEQNNIDWSKQLEDAGCSVIYGVDNYKVHSKLMVITRKKNGKLSYITQIGTGNYNEKTSKIYTDLSLITTNMEIGLEALAFFKSISLGEFIETANHLLVAPKQLKAPLIAMIDQEIALAKQGQVAEIVIKINSFSDKELIDKLLEASQAGVRIKLFVRGICCFKAGVAGVSDNIIIKSIVGRFLEHSRIYVFGVGPRQKIYIGSADWMTRNTQFRVEVAVEILDKRVQETILYLLEILDYDNVKARIMDDQGNYKHIPMKQFEQSIDSQILLYEHFAQERADNRVIPAKEKQGILQKIKSFWPWKE